MSKILEIKDISKIYQGKESEILALSNINFQIEEGEFVSIIGPSGCGKSTLLSIIAGLEEKTTGNIYIEQEKVTGISEKIGYMLQRDCLLEWKTILDNTLFGLEIKKQLNKDTKAYAKSLLKKYDLYEFKDKYPTELSGGMRQRIVIAIALSCDPYVLICDEPTTALDVTIQAKILELIQDIQKKKQLSVIYITHDLGVVAKVADFVNVMYAGKIIETGTIDEIFYDPRHPYTWGLLSSMPDLDTDDDELYTIPGTPPNLAHKVEGDAFAPRNQFALNIDKRIEPPMFDVPGSKTHKVASWLMHEKAPKVEMPKSLQNRLKKMKKEGL